jgi:hypothetical protein
VVWFLPDEVIMFSPGCNFTWIVILALESEGEDTKWLLVWHELGQRDQVAPERSLSG